MSVHYIAWLLKHFNTFLVFPCNNVLKYINNLYQQSKCNDAVGCFLASALANQLWAIGRFLVFPRALVIANAHHVLRIGLLCSMSLIIHRPKWFSSSVIKASLPSIESVFSRILFLRSCLQFARLLISSCFSALGNSNP